MAMMVRSTAPIDGEAVLSLDRVKMHLKVEDDSDDLLIGAFRDGALDWIEKHTAKSLTRRGWVATLDGFADRVRLPREPVVAVTEVGFLDTVGNASVLAQEGWRLAGSALVTGVARSWPATIDGDGGVTVTFQAGFADIASEAPALVTAALLLVGHLYRNREQVITGTIATSVPFGVTELCSGYRTPVFG